MESREAPSLIAFPSASEGAMAMKNPPCMPASQKR